MADEVKEIKLRMPVALYEEFFRKFPRRGERQTVLLRLVATLVERAGKNERLYREIVEELRN
jgi:hypothetical protein